MAVVERVERTAQVIEKEGIIAHIRLSTTQDIVGAINSVLLGGINIVELPAQITKWQDLIKKARAEFGADVTLGVSGVLDRRTALNAVQAGADYVSSPHTERGIVELCKEEGIIVMQGAMTPNEIFRAQQTGADFVTVMPASLYGGAYVENMLYTYGDVHLIPSGGIDDQMALAMLKAGAKAVSVDQWLVNDQFVSRRQFDEIQKRASTLRKAVAKRVMA
jgi:2-dehydro-3-deoxyphosphogluconate aldolase/(4S)-4-hydroxy-2-oxoglutarate aldolase